MKNVSAIIITILVIVFLFIEPPETDGQSYISLTQPVSGKAMRTSSGDPNWDHGNDDNGRLKLIGNAFIGESIYNGTTLLVEGAPDRTSSQGSSPGSI